MKNWKNDGVRTGNELSRQGKRFHIVNKSVTNKRYD